MKFFQKNQKQKDIIDDDLSESGRTTVVDPYAFPLKTYPQAWLALLLLVILRTAISVFQFTFSVVPTLTGELFGVSLSSVNWLANIQGVMYVIVSFFTGWIFQRLGVKKSVTMTINRHYSSTYTMHNIKPFIFPLAHSCRRFECNRICYPLSCSATSSCLLCPYHDWSNYRFCIGSFGIEHYDHRKPCFMHVNFAFNIHMRDAFLYIVCCYLVH